ncbi:MAG: LysM peptidoglycan-binding domain-containing protein [Lachnospira sp.]|nr:LysM peptidoglycan-binding domain-containing protein [Lachnospira sp.]
MIEIICDGGDDKGENANSVNSTGIRRPKNIKQIGDVSSGKQIYIEDYAFTYINSIAYNCRSQKQAGVLLGELQNDGEERCVFIKGVVKARLIDGNHEICFDENVWNGIYTDVEKYFPNLQIVGWFVVMPQVTELDMRKLKKIHLDQFSGNMKVLYLVDAAEKEENFYLYDKDELRRQKGYVCFYERNCEMQEYMLERKVKKSSEENNNDKVMESIRNVIHEKEEVRHQKRSNSFTYGFTALMVTAVLVTTINLMNNYQKMQKFDQSIKKLTAQMSGDESDVEQAGTEEGVVSVNKLAGDVYPTEKQAETTEAATEKETREAHTEPVSPEASNVAKTPAYSEYSVQQGDSIMSICKRHYGSIDRYEEVLALNQLEDPNMLYVGEIIKLP